MRNLRYLLLIAAVLTCLLIAVPGNALFNSDVKKAKEFMAAGMYPQAIELLNKRIGDKPTDAEAHYQLGICYINTGKYSKADERFGSAVRLEPDYGYKIGDEYKNAGDEALRNGSSGKAKTLYQMVVKYQPDLRNDISQNAFNQGKAFFDQRNYNIADSIFSVATTFDSRLRQPISDMYFNLGNSVEGKWCIDYYRIARKYSSAHNWEIGQRLAELAKEPKTSEAEKKKFKEEAINYLSKAEMDKAFPPDFKLYPVGTYTIALKAGEKTKLWFTFPDGVRIALESKDYQYKIIYPDGDVKEAWKLKRMPSKYKFKLEAITDQVIKLRVVK